MQAVKGFNVIATANDRDKGVNDLSSALKRRFNTVVLPLPATVEAETEIVSQRVASLGRALEIPARNSRTRRDQAHCHYFSRAARRSDVRWQDKAEIAKQHSEHRGSNFRDGPRPRNRRAFWERGLRADDVAAGLLGAVVKDPVQDRIVWREYMETVMKKRRDWSDLYRACRDITD